MFAFDWRLFLTIHNPLVTMWPVLSFFLVAFFACLIINDFACTAWTHFFFAEWYSWYYLILSTICIQLMIIISPKNVIDLRSTIPVLCKNVGGMESATVSARKGLITFKFSHKDNLQNISCGDNGSLCIMLPQCFWGGNKYDQRTIAHHQFEVFCEFYLHFILKQINGQIFWKMTTGSRTVAVADRSQDWIGLQSGLSLPDGYWRPCGY